jgi:hypothetical protein
MTENEMKVKLHKIIAENSKFTTWTISTPHIMMLVQQAIEEEREACAKVCDELDASEWAESGEYTSGYGDEIRKRNNT